MYKPIEIKGAKQNNLKNVNISIPKNNLVVFTGLSGSGKSSLVYEVIYAEGKRRLLDCFSAFQRMQLGKVKEPDIEKIEGLSATVAINQKQMGRNIRSTVGTATNLYNYVRLLYSRGSYGICPNCGQAIPVLNRNQIVSEIMKCLNGKTIKLYAAGLDLLEYTFIKELSVERENIQKIYAGIGEAFDCGDGIAKIEVMDSSVDISSFGCPKCGTIIKEIPAIAFSFHDTMGICPKCSGLGVCYEVDPNRIIPDKSKSINDGAVILMGWRCDKEKFHKNRKIYEALARTYDFSLSTPVGELKEDALKVILYGTGDEKIIVENPSVGGPPIKERFPGLVKIVEKRALSKEDISMVGGEDKNLIVERMCPVCGGNKLKPSRMLYHIKGKNINEIIGMSLLELNKFLLGYKREDCSRSVDYQVALQILQQMKKVLNLLLEMGLGYLSMDRVTATLSGGELQRVKLVRQLYSGLEDMIYVFDEPSIGLHSRDSDKLLHVLKLLRDKGNTILVIEHDLDIIKGADYIVEVGPGAGTNGGSIIASGMVSDIMKNEDSIIAKYLEDDFAEDRTRQFRGARGFLEIVDATRNNLHHVNVKLPLKCFIGITGVSGSGKSTFVNDILYQKLYQMKHKNNLGQQVSTSIYGADAITDVIYIDQKPIGQNVRSNPITYLEVFTDIRKVFAKTEEAKAANFKEKYFSFNNTEGQCLACKGMGKIITEMQFMPSIETECEICHGMGYKDEILHITYKGKNIYEVLQMDVDQAIEFFQEEKKIVKKLELLKRMGLGYLTLGQPSNTLSGGEAQRIKLAKELGDSKTENKTDILYILDEPTTGLHIEDVKKMLEILQELVDSGNTVLVIEHNLELIKTLDYIVDFGPEGGEFGGKVIAKGSPKEVAKVQESYTGQYLRKYFSGSKI